jgi:hypothetical protein
MVHRETEAKVKCRRPDGNAPALILFVWDVSALVVFSSLVQCCRAVSGALHFALYLGVHEIYAPSYGRHAAFLLAYAVVWLVARRTSLAHGYMCRFLTGSALGWAVFHAGTPLYAPVLVSLLPSGLLWWGGADDAAGTGGHDSEETSEARRESAPADAAKMDGDPASDVYECLSEDYVAAARADPDVVRRIVVRTPAEERTLGAYGPVLSGAEAVELMTAGRGRVCHTRCFRLTPPEGWVPRASGAAQLHSRGLVQTSRHYSQPARRTRAAEVASDAE